MPRLHHLMCRWRSGFASVSQVPPTVTLELSDLGARLGANGRAEGGPFTVQVVPGLGTVGTLYTSVYLSVERRRAAWQHSVVVPDETAPPETLQAELQSIYGQDPVRTAYIAHNLLSNLEHWQVGPLIHAHLFRDADPSDPRPHTLRLGALVEAVLQQWPESQRELIDVGWHDLQELMRRGPRVEHILQRPEPPQEPLDELPIAGLVQEAHAADDAPVLQVLSDRTTLLMLAIPTPPMMGTPADEPPSTPNGVPLSGLNVEPPSASNVEPPSELHGESLWALNGEPPSQPNDQPLSQPIGELPVESHDEYWADPKAQQWALTDLPATIEHTMEAPHPLNPAGSLEPADAVIPPERTKPPEQTEPSEPFDQTEQTEPNLPRLPLPLVSERRAPTPADSKPARRMTGLLLLLLLVGGGSVTAWRSVQRPATTYPKDLSVENGVSVSRPLPDSTTTTDLGVPTEPGLLPASPEIPPPDEPSNAKIDLPKAPPPSEVCLKDKDGDKSPAEYPGETNGCKTFATKKRDCKDDDVDIHPMSKGRCNGLDNNCDGKVECDAGIPVDDSRWYSDRLLLATQATDCPYVRVEYAFPNDQKLSQAFLRSDNKKGVSCVVPSGTSKPGADLCANKDGANGRTSFILADFVPNSQVRVKWACCLEVDRRTCGDLSERINLPIPDSKTHYRAPQPSPGDLPQPGH